MKKHGRGLNTITREERPTLARARSEYYNERRKANARLSTFTKDEALKTIRKNFMQAPKY